MRTAIVPTLLLVACAGSPHSGRGAGVEPGKGPENTVPGSALPRADCDDVTAFTLDDLAAGKGDGERIGIDLVPAVVNSYCTALDCGDAECCNQCGGEYGARLTREPAERDLWVTFTGSLLAGCGGMECNFHCEPFGRKPSTAYRFVGTATFRPAGQTSLFHHLTLAVEKFCQI